MALTLEQQLGLLTMVAWIVLIPVAALLCLLLFRLITLLDAVKSFVDSARYDVDPLLQHLRATASHVEALTEKAKSGVSSVESGVRALPSQMGSGAKSLAQGMRFAGTRLGAAALPLARGLWRLFK
ncbi:MAG: hypothetical protein VKJ06_06550 [Vampirovibrionales bacterium]|nr:hypothetical protein [Vampirovibrionales bacterium]